DGQDNPFITVNAMKFYEIQKYVTTIRYLFSLEPIIMSEELFQAQSPEMQKMILDAGKEATAYSKEWLMNTEASIKASLVEKGMVITEAADGEKAWIEKATQAVWPKYYDSIGGKDKLENALKILGRSL
ncbi:MAG: C4-dicarboxylate ABC transporter substrate-binding protein, partial [Desulfobacterales bacterium]|nr:C4-dicarboxylate ABC transporter substrate-binding protein [Desulfobacterales bacterium]